MTSAPIDPAPQRLVLASASPARAALLRQAELDFEVATSGVDETAVKAAFSPGDAGAMALARRLADLKAEAVSRKAPGAVVIGSDQVLACGTRLFDKPANVAMARESLRFLRGRRHELHSAAALYRDGAPLWRGEDTARLWMRRFSDAFLDRYLAAEGDGVRETVGAYRLEGRGVLLFERLEGDPYTILGLPLLSLLEALRTRGLAAG